MNKANGRLTELEKRTATLGMLHEFDLRIQDCLARFEDNWTNAVLVALSIQEPFRAFVETNTVIQPNHDMGLQGLDWLKRELDSDDKGGAKVSLSDFQKALHRQISACEDIRTIEGDFRAVLADLERVRSELRVERGKPLDVRRALRTARRYVAEAKRKIDLPGTEFVGATCDIECAKNYAADVRVAGGQGRDLDRVESSIVETERLLRLRYFRQHIQEARDWMAKERPRDALNSIRICEQSDLAELRTDIEYNACRDELTELKRAADKMAENQANAAGETAIAKVRVEYGFSEWPLTASTNLVSETWEPSLQWTLDSGAVVETNREEGFLAYSIVQGRSVVAEVKLEHYDSNDGAREGLLNYLALCASPEPLAFATNAWNQAGERCYVDNPTTTNSIVLFYRKNVFVSVFSKVGWFDANTIAQELDGELVAEE